MAIFIGVLLALLSIGVVLYPFLKPRSVFRQETAPLDSDPEGPDLESIYDSIHTLELEHQLGNIPQALYREQLGAYRVQAARALRQEMAAAQDSEQILEREIALVRSSLAQRNGNTHTCSNCGSTIGAQLTQCPECSVEMGRGGREESAQ